MTSAAPEKRLLTPFNAVTAIIVLVGAGLIFLRFYKGLAAITDASDASFTNPWGILIGVNVMCGVALSAGGFVMGTAVHLFGMNEYKPLVRPAILVGFIGYFFVVVGLCVDLGRPWRLPYPIVYSLGVTSVLFLVGWHVLLYLSTQAVEFSPAVFEWLGWKRWRKVAVAVTIGATIFGVILSTLHQSALGALFLIAPTKVHPLWYSEFIPLFFFVSAIVGGLSMVILESTLAKRYLGHLVETSKEKLDELTLGLGKASSITLAVFFAIKVIGIGQSNTWKYLATPMGHWFLVELLGFILLPCLIHAVGYRERRPGLVRLAAVWTIVGIILTRVNLSMIAFNWNLPAEQRYHPRWMEIWISITVFTCGVLTYRWVVNRMPVLREHPLYKGMH